ncbi:hypothetical protein OP10G_0499 [Fimbriimonas ginsengisoli Gsoil 348]|uniref:Uncharacterized protein n=1 Tax=Fimbriimonas ginsengisoli Gsoil 348 TaxID=661478 RepID=A0A068NK90_FIMGI|nr:hypothetical protein OP10G_0499 [Fimbriimonas ginsengisoli Gsoil 348]
MTQAGPTAFRYYSLFGRHSTASLRFSLEPGFTGFISQKIQRIPHDGDPDQLDEAYVQDEGIWRIGKQYMPFGTGEILRDSVIGARADTTQILEGIPMTFMVCDSGSERQRGVMAHVGSRALGGSFAIGRHWGINGTSLTQIRRPEDTGGLGHGWEQVYGIDASRLLGRFFLQAEAVHFRQGATKSDGDHTIFDFNVTVSQRPLDWLTFGYTKDASSQLTFFRVRGSVELTENVILQPFIRFRDARLWDLGAEVRFKI